MPAKHRWSPSASSTVWEACAPSNDPRSRPWHSLLTGAFRERLVHDLLCPEARRDQAQQRFGVSSGRAFGKEGVSVTPGWGVGATIFHCRLFLKNSALDRRPHVSASRQSWVTAVPACVQTASPSPSKASNVLLSLPEPPLRLAVGLYLNRPPRGSLMDIRQHTPHCLMPPLNSNPSWLRRAFPCHRPSRFSGAERCPGAGIVPGRSF